MLVRVIVITIEILTTRWRAIASAIFLPSVVMVLVYTFVPLAIQSPVFLAVLRFLAYCWLAVNIHRAALLGESTNKGWGWRETRFAGALFAIAVTLVGIVAGTLYVAQSIGMPASGVLAGVIEGVLTAAVLYWASQYFLIFPAIAVDHKYSIASSAVDTEEYRAGTFIVVAVFPLLLSVIALPGLLLSNVVISSFVTSMLSIVSITIAVTLLSGLYRELVPNGT